MSATVQVALLLADGSWQVRCGYRVKDAPWSVDGLAKTNVVFWKPLSEPPKEQHA